MLEYHGDKVTAHGPCTQGESTNKEIYSHGCSILETFLMMNHGTQTMGPLHTSQWAQANLFSHNEYHGTRLRLETVQVCISQTSGPRFYTYIYSFLSESNYIIYPSFSSTEILSVNRFARNYNYAFIFTDSNFSVKDLNTWNTLSMARVEMKSVLFVWVSFSKSSVAIFYFIFNVFIYLLVVDSCIINNYFVVMA